MREIKFNAWLPKIGYMLEDISVGYYSIGFPYEEDDDFDKFLKSKGFNPDECEMPDWIYDTGEDWYQVQGQDNFILLQFTGLKDKNGVEIYEGDIVRFREPYRSHQTHYGNNIPNGSYTEAMEPLIRTIETPVYFDRGCFTVTFERNDDDGYASDDLVWPLDWVIRDYDEEDIKLCIATGRPHHDEWHGEDGNLKWLLEGYKLTSLDELITYCSGIEVIGSIYQHPELIK